METWVLLVVLATGSGYSVHCDNQAKCLEYKQAIAEGVTVICMPAKTAKGISESLRKTADVGENEE